MKAIKLLWKGEKFGGNLSILLCPDNHIHFVLTPEFGSQFQGQSNLADVPEEHKETPEKLVEYVLHDIEEMIGELSMQEKHQAMSNGQRLQ